MKKFLRCFVLAALPGSLCGCALLGPQEPPIPEATLPSWLGRVVMVDTVHRFVLVDTGAVAAPAPGVMVTTLREKRRTGVLRVTADVRPPYVAMEIVEGDPQSGDQAAVEEGAAVPVSPQDGI